MTFDAAEKHQFQIPALQMPATLGFKPPSQAQAVHVRGGRLRNALLDGILADQLLRINGFTYRDRTYPPFLTNARFRASKEGRSRLRRYSGGKGSS